MASMRDLGTALYTWLTDRTELTPPVEVERLSREAREAEKASGPRKRGVYLWGWQPMHSMSHDEVVAILHPRDGRPYIDEVPRFDAWGRPFEYMGWPENIFNAEVFAIRSAGPNGRFEGPRYEEGAVAPGGPGDDIVWADGFFVRWPDGGEEPQ